MITVFDPIIHSAADAPGDDAPEGLRLRRRHDPRHVLCRRPTAVTGGELKLDMLDLVYDATARTYQAPLQPKSTGGVFIVDDFGRQEEPPQALVNRWIVPLEESRAILALQSGEKFEIPFDVLVIFSTNFHPARIQAALRRIFCKIRVDGPGQADFPRIFSMVAGKKGLPVDEGALLYPMKEKSPGPAMPMPATGPAS